jgi:hypothetical protein
MNDWQMREFLNYFQIESTARFLGESYYLAVDRFAAGLPDRIAGIQALMDQSESIAEQAETDRLKAAIHRLKGSAMTCGFASLGDLLNAFQYPGTNDFQRLDACARESIAEWRSFRTGIPT